MVPARSLNALWAAGPLLWMLAGGASASDLMVYPTRPFWGDTHLHTSNSPDASMNGNVRIGPAEAFRFARGQSIQGHNGQTAQLARPLDFLVVSDHAEYLGLLPRIRSRDPRLISNETARRWADLIASDDKDDNWQAMFEVLRDIETNKPGITDESITKSVWHEAIETADTYNEPGTFTAFIGFEWTSMPGGNNIHRVVIFRDGADLAGQVLPFSSFDSEDPEDLWRYMAAYERDTGGSVLAIPHNGNLSNGKMFAWSDHSGNPIDREYAEARSHWEPLYEVTQIKGDGETHPALSPGDQFADFETWDHGNLTSTVPKEEYMLKFEYARSALGMGLVLSDRTGVNPYQFGMIGSSDAHTGLAAVAENNFWGKFSIYEPGLLRLSHHPIVKGSSGKAYDLWAYETSASGYAAVWATDNTREALFDAMKRREVYATTGSRISLRFFGGWDFTKQDARHRNFVSIGYRRGVSMGGELAVAPPNSKPSFLIHVAKDPDGVDISIVQIVKGWFDESGQSRESISDLLIKYEGAAEFVGYWSDPDFDVSRPAFYYVRVLEVERERWTSLDAERFHAEFEGDVPTLIRDRAYSSPIWYAP